jgi:hypothetical protein
MTDSELFEEEHPELEAVAVENAILRAECNKLESGLASLARGQDLNLAQLQQTREALLLENEELEAEINEKRELLEEAKAFYLTMRRSGRGGRLLLPDTLVSELNKNIVEGETDDELDLGLSRIVASNSYFQRCTSNSAFIDRCREMMDAISKAQKSKDITRPIADRIEFQRYFAGKAIKMKRIIREKDQIETCIEQHRTNASIQQQEGNDGPSPTDAGQQSKGEKSSAPLLFTGTLWSSSHRSASTY